MDRLRQGLHQPGHRQAGGRLHVACCAAFDVWVQAVQRRLYALQMALHCRRHALSEAWRSLVAAGAALDRRVVAARRPRSALRSDFVVKGAPLRGELKAAGISLVYYFAAWAHNRVLAMGNETAGQKRFCSQFLQRRESCGQRASAQRPSACRRQVYSPLCGKIGNGKAIGL